MINKQNLWFLTLFSLILVLSVYYITMPNDLLVSKESNNVVSKSKKSSDDKTKTTVEETNSLVALRVSLEEERQEKMVSLQETLTNEESSTDEKNTAYEQLKYLNQLQGQEENLEKQIFSLSSDLNKINYKKENDSKIILEKQNKLTTYTETIDKLNKNK